MWLVFVFKHKTAYELRISDWSSDVCSSDLSPASTPDTSPDSAPAATMKASPMTSSTSGKWATFQTVLNGGVFGSVGSMDGIPLDSRPILAVPTRAGKRFGISPIGRASGWEGVVSEV